MCLSSSQKQGEHAGVLPSPLQEILGAQGVADLLLQPLLLRLVCF